MKTNNIGSYTTVETPNYSEIAGKLGNIPVSHGNEKAGGGASLGVIMLIVGIVLWAVGASQGNPSMVLAGKILVGIPLAATALALIAGCCAWCLNGCASSL